LKKTKKNVPFHRVFQLSELKESVCSFTESCGEEAKMEESQILMDYFHPTEKRMSEMEEYMKSKGVELSLSTHSKR
jgi:phosphopantothenate synthetase